MKKIFSLLLSFVMLISIVSLVDFSAFATSMPTTTITSVKAQNKAFTVKWKKKSSITGYQIQYSTNSKFKKGNKSIKIKNAKTISKKITKLKVAKKYYVRIRTYKGKKYSKWSKVKSIKTPKESKCTKDNIQKETHCTNNNNHSIKCGNMGRWFNSRSELVAYYNSEVSKWNKKIDNEEITYDEYYKNVPSGYECWSCSYCGKWTGNLKHY
ncbi:MAG TPA: fibronectin type III domain-containing protein [Oscillospiraceae bacterium]|nr:fibronectin type III domain-containing protein [Oscillospiraceae bacterium]